MSQEAGFNQQHSPSSFPRADEMASAMVSTSGRPVHDAAKYFMLHHHSNNRGSEHHEQQQQHHHHNNASLFLAGTGSGRTPFAPLHPSASSSSDAENYDSSLTAPAPRAPMMRYADHSANISQAPSTSYPNPSRTLSPVSEGKSYRDQGSESPTSPSNDSTKNGELNSQSFYDPHQVKHRRRTSPEQLEVLTAQFMLCSKPDMPTRKKLSAELGMTIREVQVWFQNRRAKQKKLDAKSAEADASYDASATNDEDPSTSYNVNTYPHTRNPYALPASNGSYSFAGDAHNHGPYQQPPQPQQQFGGVHFARPVNASPIDVRRPQPTPLLMPPSARAADPRRVPSSDSGGLMTTPSLSPDVGSSSASSSSYLNSRYMQDPSRASSRTGSSESIYGTGASAGNQPISTAGYGYGKEVPYSQMASASMIHAPYNALPNNAEQPLNAGNDSFFLHSAVSAGELARRLSCPEGLPEEEADYLKPFVSTAPATTSLNALQEQQQQAHPNSYTHHPTNAGTLANVPQGFNRRFSVDAAHPSMSVSSLQVSEVFNRLRQNRASPLAPYPNAQQQDGTSQESALSSSMPSGFRFPYEPTETQAGVPGFHFAPLPAEDGSESSASWYQHTNDGAPPRRSSMPASSLSARPMPSSFHASGLAGGMPVSYAPLWEEEPGQEQPLPGGLQPSAHIVSPPLAAASVAMTQKLPNGTYSGGLAHRKSRSPTTLYAPYPMLPVKDSSLIKGTASGNTNGTSLFNFEADGRPQHS